MFSKDGKVFVHNSKDNVRPLQEGPANDFYEIFKATGSITPFLIKMLLLIRHISLQQYII